MSTAEIDALYLQFKARAEAVSSIVYRVSDVPEANSLVAGLLKELGGQKIVMSPSYLGQGLAERLRREGFIVHTTDLRQQAPAADVGISQLDIAVAETGSIVQDATNVESRVVSTLPSIHLALVPTNGLKATLGEALSTLYGSGRVPGYISFITGPSRTSDIERVLTIGVHGPEKLLIVFVDQGGQI